MKYQNLCLLFSSCDNYEDSWAPFFTLWKKYWPQFENPIYIGTETKQFSSAGLDIRCPLCRIKDDLSSWSKRLIKLLDYVEEDYILFCLDDFWLYKDVNEYLFEKCYDYFLQHNDIGFMCLIEQEHGEQYKKHIPEFPMVYESTRNKPFMINTQVGLWRKSYLKKVLKSHESAWFFETRATWRAAHWYKERVFYVNTESNRVFFYPEGGVFWGGKFYTTYAPLYEESIIKNIKRVSVSFEEEMKRRDIAAKKGRQKNLLYMLGLLRSVMP